MASVTFSVDGSNYEVDQNEIDQKAASFQYLKIKKVANGAIGGSDPLEAEWVTIPLLERFFRWLLVCCLQPTDEKCKACSAKALKRAAKIKPDPSDEDIKGKLITGLTPPLFKGKSFSGKALTKAKSALKIDFSKYEATDKLEAKPERLDTTQLDKLLQEVDDIFTLTVATGDKAYDYIYSIHEGSMESQKDAKAGSNQAFRKDIQFILYEISKETDINARRVALRALVNNLNLNGKNVTGQNRSSICTQMKVLISQAAQKQGKKEPEFEDVVKDLAGELKQPPTQEDLVSAFILVVNDQSQWNEGAAYLNLKLMDWFVKGNSDLYEKSLYEEETDYPDYFPEPVQAQEDHEVAYISEEVAIRILTRLGYIREKTI